MNKKRLLKLANFLEELPPKLFDIRVIRSNKEINVKKALECGTTACAIGWCPTVFPKLCRVGSNCNDIVLRSCENVSNFRVADSIFDLKDNEVYYLFSDAHYHPSARGPKTVVKRIRSFVSRNGNVSKSTLAWLGVWGRYETEMTVPYYFAEYPSFT